MSKVCPNSNYEVEKIAFKDTSLGYLQAQGSKSELFSLICQIYVEIRIFQLICFIFCGSTVLWVVWSASSGVVRPGHDHVRRQERHAEGGGDREGEGVGCYLSSGLT